MTYVSVGVVWDWLILQRLFLKKIIKLLNYYFRGVVGLAVMVWRWGDTSEKV